MRFFNTAGPVVAADHYLVPPLSRIDLAAWVALVEQKKYFVLHAPRQTGKTSSLLAFAEHLNVGGRYECLYVNVEGAQAAREDVPVALRAILGNWVDAARGVGDDVPESIWLRALDEYGPSAALTASLRQWAERSEKPLVLLIDEIDTLIGDTLVSVLRQLRAGYADRPGRFPQSVVLCGVRDVRDYRIRASSEKSIITGGSAFNVKAESWRMGLFDRGDVEGLLAQHTAECGQVFEPDAVETMWDLTRGQPWLVNALSYEACFKIAAKCDGTEPITEAMVQEARERLIERRETHLDQLASTLREERMRRVLEPMLASEDWRGYFDDDDLQYCIDLGLVVSTDGIPQIANPIYCEVLPRQLTSTVQANFAARFSRASFIDGEGALKVTALFEAFGQFYRENSEWEDRVRYGEASRQLLLQAFLQRVINGGGLVDREYGLSRGRTDLLIRWPLADGFGPGKPVQRVIIELKVLRKKRSLDTVVAEGLAQTAAYMEVCGAAEGHLVVFDCRAGRSWDEKIFRRDEMAGEYAITVWGM